MSGIDLPTVLTKAIATSNLRTTGASSNQSKPSWAGLTSDRFERPSLSDSRTSTVPFGNTPEPPPLQDPIPTFEAYLAEWRRLQASFYSATRTRQAPGIDQRRAADDLRVTKEANSFRRKNSHRYRSRANSGSEQTVVGRQTSLDDAQPPPPATDNRSDSWQQQRTLEERYPQFEAQRQAATKDGTLPITFQNQTITLNQARQQLADYRAALDGYEATMNTLRQPSGPNEDRRLREMNLQALTARTDQAAQQELARRQQLRSLAEQVGTTARLARALQHCMNEYQHGTSP